MLFIRESDLDSNGKLENGVNVEPLILRAAAGDWIKVTLINQLPSDPKQVPFNVPQPFWYGTPFYNRPPASGTSVARTLDSVRTTISQQVGLHPQLVAFDVRKANGINVGFNPPSTVGPGGSIDYYWYAGQIVQKDGKTIETPVEFGATNLVGADMILQSQFGFVGALIVEPLDSTWVDDKGSHAFSTVTKCNGEAFRECVLVMQNMVANKSPGRETLPDQTGGRDAGFGAVNYRTENFATRNIPTVNQVVPDVGFGNAFSNSLLKPPADPQTPGILCCGGDADSVPRGDAQHHLGQLRGTTRGLCPARPRLAGRALYQERDRNRPQFAWPNALVRRK